MGKKNLITKVKSIVSDGWANIYNKKGIKGSDPATGAFFNGAIRLTESQLNEIYVGDGFSRKIIDRPTSEMVREWFRISGDIENQIINFLNGIGTKRHILQALRWADLFGGSVIVMGIDDGAGDLETPLNEENIKSIDWLRPYDRHRVTWTANDVSDDPTSEFHGLPEVVLITPNTIHVPVTPFRVHRSRLLFFKGLPVTDRELGVRMGWGQSRIENAYSQLIRFDNAFHSVNSTITDFIQTILRIDNLQSLIASGREDLVKKRLEIIDLGKSVLNTILLDKEEEFEKKASSVTGISDLIDRIASALSGVTDMPVSILMGRSRGGLSKSDDEIIIWHEVIGERQEDELLEPLERLVFLSQIAGEGPTDGKELDNWAIEFNPLDSPSEKEVSETRRNQADTDEKYIQIGVVLPEEIRESRFGGDTYSIETVIDENIKITPIEETEETSEEDI